MARKKKSEGGGGGGGGAAVAERPVDRPKPILGVDMKGELRDIDIGKIIDPGGPADRLARPGDDAAIEQLARSMRECGQLQPIMVEDLGDGRFRRVFGRRRLAAASRLQWITMRASVVPELDDNVRRTIVAVENVQRQDLTPAEETLAVDELMLLQAPSAAVQLGKPLLDGCGAWSHKEITPAMVAEMAAGKDKFAAAIRHDLLLDHRVRHIASELVAAMLGKPASWVRDRLYIGRLSDKSKRLVLEGKLPLAHAREISKVADEKRREDLVRAYAAGGTDSIGDTEPGALEDLQEEVRRSVFTLHVVPWKRDVAFAGQPTCDGCPHNSATNPGLFEGGGEVSTDMIGGRGTYGGVDANSAKVAAAGICTLPRCYADKLRAAKAAISATAKKICAAGKKAVEVKIPAYVSRAEVEKKVKARKVWHKGGGSKPSKPSGPTPAQKAAEERRRAEGQLDDALRKEAGKLEPKIAAALAKTKGAWVVYHLIRQSKLFQATEHHDEAKKRKAAASPELARLLTLLKKPSWEAVLELEKHCGTKYALIEEWDDGPSGMARKLAEALGVELDPAPTLEDFLPQAEKVKPAKDAPEGNGKRSGRSASKSARGAGSAPESGSEDNTEFGEAEES
jgi:hypothetical protein